MTVTVTDTTSCGTADSAVSERDQFIKIKH